MLIRHVAINRFRGIKSLDWHVKGRLVCLVGPGNSTKTTVLDAIEFALAPRWYVPFSDADFYEANTTQPLSIEITVGELADKLLSDDRCGLYLRGYRPNEPINDDPEDGWEPVVSVRLQVSEDLEPQWELVKESTPAPKQLSWRDRERFGMARLGDNAEQHLIWSRGPDALLAHCSVGIASLACGRENVETPSLARHGGRDARMASIRSPDRLQAQPKREMSVYVTPFQLHRACWSKASQGRRK